jgi:thiamine pyrophosphate-dependent acetolactate synthase large subunit-like protein
MSTTATGTLEQKTEGASESAPQNLTDGFHLVIDALKLNGIKTIYNVPGIPITDLGRFMQAEGMRVLSFRHEQHAGYAAAIAGFLTKKPGICMTVSAPGFLNGLTALAHATTNCYPMILMSGSSEREIVDLQQGDYEEMDQLAIAKPLCKAAFRVLNAEDIGIGIARAIRAAVSGRPGGVYLDLPAALLGQTMDAAAGEKSLVKVVDPAPAQIPSAEAVQGALEVLKGAKRPLIILGKGAAYAQADDAIRELVEKSGVPYLAMSMAKGLLPDTHPQYAGAARSLVLKESDVVMLIGARLNWLLSHGKGKTWGEEPKKFIHIDIDPKEMDSNVEIAAPLVGDIESCVKALLDAMGTGPRRSRKRSRPTSPEWRRNFRTTTCRWISTGRSACCGRSSRSGPIQSSSTRARTRSISPVASSTYTSRANGSMLVPGASWVSAWDRRSLLPWKRAVPSWPSRATARSDSPAWRSRPSAGTTSPSASLSSTTAAFTAERTSILPAARTWRRRSS